MTITPLRRRRLLAGRAAVVLVLVALVASLTSPATADPRLDPAARPSSQSWRGRSCTLTRSRPAATALSRLRARQPLRPSSARLRGVRLVECQAAPGGYCGTLRVPLDRAHPERGTLRLFFLYYRHTAPGPARSAIMLSEGGPGYSITNTEFEKQAYLDSFGSLMARRDLVMFDQRGVGRSGVIKCPAVQQDPAYGRPSILSSQGRMATDRGRE